MDSSSQPSARALRRRERRAAERLLDNSALRDELNDEQANQLLEWGFDRIAEAVDRTKFLPDEDAAASLEPTVTAVSQVMLAVNRLMANFAAAEGVADAENALAQFVNNLKVVQTPPADVYDQLALLIVKDNTAAVFESLIALLTASPAEDVVMDEAADRAAEVATDETAEAEIFDAEDVSSED